MDDDTATVGSARGTCHTSPQRADETPLALEWIPSWDEPARQYGKGVLVGTAAVGYLLGAAVALVWIRPL